MSLDQIFIRDNDETPIWSAPFGFELIEKCKIRKNMRVLDVGSGTGFPLLHLAEMIGETGEIFGIDPWKEANEVAREKCVSYDLKNTKILDGKVEDLFKFFPEGGNFDLVVSNNGINNCPNAEEAFCSISKHFKEKGQFVMTFNSNLTFRKFYDTLKEVTPNDFHSKIHEHINRKRMSIEDLKTILQKYDFEKIEVTQKEFYFRFVDTKTFFHYHFVRLWFLPHWKKLIGKNLGDDQVDLILEKVAKLIDERYPSPIDFMVPFYCVSCYKKERVL